MDLPQGNKKVFQRKSIITIADNSGDIIIRDFSLKVWIEGGVACFEGKKQKENIFFIMRRNILFHP